MLIYTYNSILNTHEVNPELQERMLGRSFRFNVEADSEFSFESDPNFGYLEEKAVEAVGKELKKTFGFYYEHTALESLIKRIPCFDCYMDDYVHESLTASYEVNGDLWQYSETDVDKLIKYMFRVLAEHVGDKLTKGIENYIQNAPDDDEE
jgi:hypothetical protein